MRSGLAEKNNTHQGEHGTVGLGRASVHILPGILADGLLLRSTLTPSGLPFGKLFVRPQGAMPLRD